MNSIVDEAPVRTETGGSGESTVVREPETTTGGGDSGSSSSGGARWGQLRGFCGRRCLDSAEPTGDGQTGDGSDAARAPADPDAGSGTGRDPDRRVRAAARADDIVARETPRAPGKRGPPRLRDPSATSELDAGRTRRAGGHLASRPTGRLSLTSDEFVSRHGSDWINEWDGCVRSRRRPEFRRAVRRRHHRHQFAYARTRARICAQCARQPIKAMVSPCRREAARHRHGPPTGVDRGIARRRGASRSTTPRGLPTVGRIARR